MRAMRVPWFLTLLLLSSILSSVVYSESMTIDVVGLFKGRAIFNINGTQRLIKQGKTSPEGITVLEANSKFVKIEMGGKVRKLTLSKKVGTVFVEADPKQTVRIARGYNGHYFTPGRINNRPCDFVVDTGASLISMNEFHARALGVDFSRGAPVAISTANGIKKSYSVVLDSVTVGTVTLFGVNAVISRGGFPEIILLGNSYLSRVEMNVDAGVLVLESKI